jgi:hypothetical protein
MHSLEAGAQGCTKAVVFQTRRPEVEDKQAQPVQ